MSTDNSQAIAFRLYDFSSPDEQMQAQGFEPGFYYDIPMPDADRSAPSEVFIQGPYSTLIAAREAAIAFIQDALSEHKEVA